MTSPGKLDCRFFWERINDGYLIYDRQRGAGCFGENFVATAVDGPTAELMCSLMNLAEPVVRLRRARAGMAAAAAAAPRLIGTVTVVI